VRVRPSALVVGGVVVSGVVRAVETGRTPGGHGHRIVFCRVRRGPGGKGLVSGPNGSRLWATGRNDRRAAQRSSPICSLHLFGRLRNIFVLKFTQFETRFETR